MLPVDQAERRRLLRCFRESNSQNLDCEAETWNAILQTFGGVAFECVIFRQKPTSGVREVFLTQRPIDDAHYPAQWHVPGSYFRVKDGAFENETCVIERLSLREIGGACITKHRFCGRFVTSDSRGANRSEVFLCDVDSTEKLAACGMWHPIDRLHEINMILHHHAIISCAAQI